MANAKSSDPAIPQNLERAPEPFKLICIEEISVINQRELFKSSFRFITGKFRAVISYDLCSEK